MNNQLYRNIFAGLFAGILFIAGFGLVYQWAGTDYASSGVSVFPKMTKSSGFELKKYADMSTGLTDLSVETSRPLSSVKSTRQQDVTVKNTSPAYNNVRIGMPAMTSRSINSGNEISFKGRENIQFSGRATNARPFVGSEAQTLLNPYGTNSAKGKNNTSNGLLAMASPSFAGSDLTESTTMQKILPGTGGDATFEELAPVPDGTWILLVVVMLYLAIRYISQNQHYKCVFKN